MRTLVTGGAGFIGSHVATALVASGHEVVIVDDLSRGKRENVPTGAELVVADITTPAAENAIAEFRPDAVFHHAAQMDVRHSVADPAFDAGANVGGTVRVAVSAAKVGCKLFVLASTGGAIYGEQERYPADESHPTRAESPYGVSKRCAEIYLDYFQRALGMRCVALRYANVYGPRQDPHGEAGVVAIFAEKMLKNEVPTIYGDGEQTRDYVYVDDVVRANLSVVANERAAGAYNIGTGIETSVNVLASHIARHARFEAKPKHAPAKPGEQRRSVLAIERARAELGWVPTTGLGVGLAATVAWFAERK